MVRLFLCDDTLRIRKPPCEPNKWCVYHQQNLGQRVCTSNTHLPPPSARPVAYAAVGNGPVVIDSLFMLLPLFVGGQCLVLVFYSGHYICNNLDGEERSGCLTLMSSRCLVIISGLWVFIAEQWVGLQCVIVVFLDHTHLFFFSRIVK